MQNHGSNTGLLSSLRPVAKPAPPLGEALPANLRSVPAFAGMRWHPGTPREACVFLDAGTTCRSSTGASEIQPISVLPLLSPGPDPAGASAGPPDRGALLFYGYKFRIM